MTGFTGFPFNRADHLRGDVEAMAALEVDWRGRLLKLTALDPAVDVDGALAWVSLAERADDGELVFLGLDDAGRPRFTELRPDHRGSAARSPALFRMLETMAPEDAAVFGAARHLLDWHSRHRFCAGCGVATGLMRAGWGRRCTACRTEQFPRTDPVVIMLAEHDGRALLGRGHLWPPRRYSALAGFVEPGESIEEAVARETFEEAGVRVSGVRYVASQPWPFPGQLMIACIAQAENGALSIDTKELQDAMWVSRAGVAAALAGEVDASFLAPPCYAIAHTLLTAWVKAE
jgi:NAD+ diphosphatase